MTKIILVLAITAAFVAGSIATGTLAFAGGDDDDELSQLACEAGKVMTGILFEEDDEILDVICGAGAMSEPESQSFVIHTNVGQGDITCPDGSVIPSKPWNFKAISTDLDANKVGLGNFILETPINNDQRVYDGIFYKATINGDQFELVGIGFTRGNNGLACPTVIENIPENFVLSGTCGVGTTTTIVTDVGITTSIVHTVACI